MKKTAVKTKPAKKEYKKPDVRKHKSVAVVSGSSDDCSSYSSTTNGIKYHL